MCLEKTQKDQEGLVGLLVEMEVEMEVEEVVEVEEEAKLVEPLKKWQVIAEFHSMWNLELQLKTMLMLQL